MILHPNHIYGCDLYRGGEALTSNTAVSPKFVVLEISLSG